MKHLPLIFFEVVVDHLIKMPFYLLYNQVLKVDVLYRWQSIPNKAGLVLISL